jgi:citrate lyase beta subunit
MSMTLVDLNNFASQIARLEKANRAVSGQTNLLSPRHSHQHPVHVLYGGAHLFSEKTFAKVNLLAKEAFQFAAPNFESLNQLIGANWSPEFSQNVFNRLSLKMEREPLEDYRIDFEDGYGARSDEEEDAHAVSAAKTLADLAQKNHTPKSIGFRIKPLSVTGMKRSLKTLALFVQTFLDTGGKNSTLKHLVVTLPKVTNAEQVATLCEILDGFESTYHLHPGYFAVEILIESPEAFLSADGTIPLPTFLLAARGRCRSIHFGVYDFTSSMGIGSAGQAIDHMAADFARMWMQVLSGLAPGLGVSDGIINRLPLLPKHSTPEAIEAFRDTWRYNYQQMTRSLMNGFYQAWDLHPSQLHIRHAANYAFVLSEFESAVSRLKTFVEKSSRASHVGGMFDDRASVLGLINFFERAVSSGVIQIQDLLDRGVDLSDVRQTI